MANYDILKQYQIDITADTTEVIKELNKLEKEASKRLKELGLTEGLRGDIEKLQTEISNLKTDLRNSINDINNGINDIKTGKLVGEFKATANGVETQIGRVQGSTNKLGDSIRNLSDNAEFKALQDNFKSMADSVNSQLESLTESFSQFKVAFTEFKTGLTSGAIAVNVNPDGLVNTAKTIEGAVDSIETQKAALQKSIQGFANIKANISEIIDVGSTDGYNKSEIEEYLSYITAIQNQYKELKGLNIKGFNVDSLFNDQDFNIETVKRFGSRFKEVLSEIDTTTKKNVPKQIDTDIRFRIKLDEDSEGTATVQSIVNKVNEVVRTAQKDIDNIYIKMGLQTDLSNLDLTPDEQDKLEKVTDDSKKLVKAIKLKAKIDANDLKNNIDDVVDLINSELKAPTAKKIEVEVVGKVNPDTIEGAANQLDEEIQHQQYNKSNGVVGRPVSIDAGSGIATESTLSEIKSILETWNGSGLPGVKDLEVKAQEAQIAKEMYDNEQFFKMRKRGDVTKAIFDKSATTEYLRATLDLTQARQEELKSLNRSRKLFKNKDASILYNSSYYKDYVEKDGIQYAKFGGGLTLDAWQKQLDAIILNGENGFEDFKTYLANEINKSKKHIKATRESLALNKVEYSKDGNILDKKGTITGTQDVYDKVQYQVNSIKENAKKNLQNQQEVTNQYIEQRKIMQEIVSLSDKAKITKLSEEEETKLNTLKFELDTSTKKISNQERYNELLERQKELDNKNIKSGLTSKELAEVQAINKEMESLFIHADKDMENYARNQTKVLSDGLSAIDRKVQESQKEEQKIITKARTEMSRLNNEHFVGVKNDEQYQRNQQKLEELTKENARLNKLIVQNKDGSYDYSAMTKAEKDKYFDNEKLIKHLKTQNILYEEQNNIQNSLIDKQETRKKNEATIANLPVSKKTNKQVAGLLVDKGRLSDEEYIKSLSDSKLLETEQIINTAKSEIAQAAQRSDSEITAIAEKMIKNDVKMLKAELKEAQETYNRHKTDNADVKTLRNDEYRISSLNSAIVQLTNGSKFGITDTLAEAQNKLNDIEKEESDVISKIKEKNNLNDDTIQKLVRILQLNKDIYDNSLDLQTINNRINSSKVVSDAKIDKITSTSKTTVFQTESGKVTATQAENMRNEASTLSQFINGLKAEKQRLLRELEQSVDNDLLNKLNLISEHQKGQNKRNGVKSQSYIQSEELLRLMDLEIQKTEQLSIIEAEESKQKHNLYNERLALYKSQIAAQSDSPVKMVAQYDEIIAKEKELRAERREAAIERQNQAEAQRKAIEKEQSYTQKTQIKHINQQYDPQITEKTQEIANLTTQLNELKSVSTNLENEALSKLNHTGYGQFVQTVTAEEIKNRETYINSHGKEEKAVERLIAMQEQYSQELIANRQKVEQLQNEQNDVLNQYRSSNFDKLSSSTIKNYRSKYSQTSQANLDEYNRLEQQYTISKNTIGEYAQETIALGEQLKQARDKYINSVMQYIAYGGSSEKINEKFFQLAQEKSRDDVSSTVKQKQNNQALIDELNHKKQIAESTKINLERLKQEAIEQVKINEEEKKYIALINEAYEKSKKSNIALGMSDEQRKASFAVDYQLKEITKLQKDLAKTDAGSEQYKKLQSEIELATERLKKYREVAKGLGLKMSDTTGRMYLDGSKKDVALGKSKYYTGTGEIPTTSTPSIEEQKAIQNAILGIASAEEKVEEQTRQTNEERKKGKSYTDGMNAEQEEAANKLAEINKQYRQQQHLIENNSKSNKRLNEEELAQLRNKVELAQQHAKAVGLGINDKGYAVLQPDATGTNTVSSTVDVNQIQSTSGLALESTLKEIKNILNGVVKVDINSSSAMGNINQRVGLLDQGSIESQNKQWREYNDLVAIGYDRIQKMNKISESGTIGNNSVYDLLRLNHEAWDEVKVNNFFNTIPEQGLQRYNKILEVVEKIVQQMLTAKGLTEEQVVKQLSDIKTAQGGNFKQNGHDSGWSHFATYTNDVKDKMYKENGLTYKVYAAFENIEDLNKDIVSSIMDALTKAGFKGRLKTTTGSTSFADKLNGLAITDQMVIHGSTKKDQEIAYNTLKNLGIKLSYLGGGVDTPAGSFSQTLQSGEIEKYVKIISQEFQSASQEASVTDETIKELNEQLKKSKRILANPKLSDAKREEWTAYRNNTLNAGNALGLTLNDKGLFEQVGVSTENIKNDTKETAHNLDLSSEKTQEVLQWARAASKEFDGIATVLGERSGDKIKYTVKNQTGGMVQFDDSGNLIKQKSALQDNISLMKQLDSIVNGNLGQRINNALTGMFDVNTAKQLTQAKDDLAQLKTAIDQIYNGTYDTSKLDELYQKMANFKNYKNIFGKNMAVGDSADLGIIDNSQTQNLQQTLTQLAMGFSGASIKVKEFTNSNRSMTYQVKSADNMLDTYVLTIDETGRAVARLAKSEKYISPLQQAISGLGKKFKEILNYTLASVSIYRIFSVFRKGIQVIKDVDAAMVELRKVSKDTTQELERFRKESYNIAQTIGSTGKDIINSAANWEKLGYAIKDASILAKNSALYANVGDMDISTATEHMTSTLKAFNIEAKDSISIVDKFNEIGNNYAITSEGIGAALERSASSLVAAGNGLDESIALITAGNIVSQDPESVGNAIKVLSLRIRGSKADLEEFGEETDGLVTSTSKLREELKSLTGVDIMLDDSTYKSTYQIMLEISQIWDNLTDVSQATVLEKLAGKTRASVVAGLLQQGETLKQVYLDSLEAEGSAIKENEKYLDSIQGHIDLFNNKWQELWDSGMSSDTINFVIDLGTELLKLADIIGLIPSLGLVTAGIFSLKSKSGGRARKKLCLCYRREVNYPPTFNWFPYGNKEKVCSQINMLPTC